MRNQVISKQFKYLTEGYKNRIEYYTQVNSRQLNFLTVKGYRA